MSGGEKGGTTTFRVAILPTARESVERFTELLEAFAARVDGVKLLISQCPYQEAVEKVVAGELDFAVPCLRPRNPDRQPFALSRAWVSKSYQVLYTNIDNPLGDDLSGCVLETIPRNLDVFPFPVRPSSDVASSLTKVADGRIDGFINAEGSTDPILRALGFKNIRRRLLRETEGHAILPKGEAGAAADRFLSQAVELCRDDPTFLMMQRRPYGEWQPS